MKPNIYPTLLLILMMATLAGCRDDSPSRYDTDGRIAFLVGTAEASTSNGGAKARARGYATATTIPLELPGDSVSMHFEMQANTDAVTPTARQSATRSIDYDESYNPVTKFQATALAADNTVYFDNLPQTIDEAGLAITDYAWPDNPLTFFAYTATKNLESVSPIFRVRRGETGNTTVATGQFYYSLPASDGRNDAVNQPDVVFAMVPNVSDNGQPVNLLFHHALSSILFKVGKMPAGTKLTSVALKGMYASGTCEMQSDAADGYNNVKFDWTVDGTATYSYVQEFGGQTATEGSRMGSEQCLFMMVPQDVQADALIELKIMMDDREYTFQKSLGEIVDVLLADHKYVFTIGLNDEVDITVDDDVVGNRKCDLSIQNTGFAASYVRATVQGCWVDDDGVVVQPWDRDYDGEFVYGAEWSNYWRLGADGFYYYLIPLARQEYTYPLFESYTLTNTSEMYQDLTLELSIVAQSVLASDYERAWTIPSESSNQP